METVERLALFVRAEKQHCLVQVRYRLCEVAENGSPLWYPLVCGGKLWTLSFLLASVV